MSIRSTEEFDTNKDELIAITKDEYDELYNGGYIDGVENCDICRKQDHTTENHLCTKCGGKGHDAKTCTVKICDICKQQGHETSKHPCDKCGGYGHPYSLCNGCYKCDAENHYAEICGMPYCEICVALQEMTKKNHHNTDEHFCSNCNESGHDDKLGPNHKYGNCAKEKTTTIS